MPSCPQPKEPLSTTQPLNKAFIQDPLTRSSCNGTIYRHVIISGFEIFVVTITNTNTRRYKWLYKGSSG